MLKDKVLSIIGALFFLGALIFSFILFPSFMVGWAAALCFLGSAIALVGFILAFFDAFSTKRTWAYNAKIVCCGIGITLFVLTLIIVGFIALATNLENKRQTFTTTAAETVVEPVVTDLTDVVTAVPQTVAVPTVPLTDPALEHGALPQYQIGHPDFYVETGTNDVYKWELTVKDGEVGIVGGFSVDGITNGVYRAYAPGTYTITIQNGFMLTVIDEWAQNEFEFRLGQAEQYNWAHDTIDYGPLTAPSK